MKVMGASVVRGAAQPGIQLTIRGEGSDSIEIHLKDAALTSASDEEICERVKKVLQEMADAPERNSSDSPGGVVDGGSSTKEDMSTVGDVATPLGLFRPGEASALENQRRSDVDDLEAIRGQISELRASVARLTQATSRIAEAHPVATVAVVVFGFWALTRFVTRRPFDRL